jgi:hypothetical protein
MKIKVLLCFLLLALTASAETPMSLSEVIEPNLKWGKPTQEELTMTEYAADKDADAVELFRQLDVYYTFINGDFRVNNVVKCRLKVLKPDGKRVANRTILLRGSENNTLRIETVRGLKAVAYNMENGKVVKTKMEHSTVHEEQIDKADKQLKFSIPQVRVGTVIEYEYHIESDFYYQLRDWYAQSNIPVLYTKYTLSIPEWFRFHIEESGMNNLEKKDDNGSLTVGSDILSTDIHTFIGRNLPALKDDDYVWRAEDYGNKVTHELQGIYIPGAVHKSYTSTWEDIDETLLKDDEFGGRIKRSSPMKDEVLAAGIPQIADTKERVEAVWQLLRQRVRWNGDYAFWAKSGSKVLKEGTGSNADINFLLINMLHDAGIEANPIALRLRDRGRLPMTHASMKYLSTFVVGITLNDSTLAYFDSSAEDGYLNVLPARLSVDRARLIRKGKPGVWVNLQETAMATQRTFIQATLDASGVISGTMSKALGGEAAAALRKTWRTAKDSTDVIRDMQEKKNIEITEYQLQGRHDFSPNLHETVKFTMQCSSTGDIIYFNPLVIAPESRNPFTAATRNLPVELPYKQREVVNVMLTLPDGWQVEETPKPIVLKFDGITASIICRQTGNQLSVVYKQDVQATFFTQQQYQDLKSFMERLVENCKNIIAIKKVA